MMDDKENLTENEILNKKLKQSLLNSTFGIHDPEIYRLRDEVAKLRKENEDLKKVLWAVADRVKDFKEDKDDPGEDI